MANTHNDNVVQRGMKQMEKNLDNSMEQGTKAAGDQAISSENNIGQKQSNATGDATDKDAGQSSATTKIATAAVSEQPGGKAEKGDGFPTSGLVLFAIVIAALIGWVILKKPGSGSNVTNHGKGGRPAQPQLQFSRGDRKALEIIEHLAKVYKKL